jgi:hypothetical protein
MNNAFSGGPAKLGNIEKIWNCVPRTQLESTFLVVDQAPGRKLKFLAELWSRT